MKKRTMIIILIVLLILLDQGTKFYITMNNEETEIISNILKFSYVENTGGAFGVGQNNTFTFIITNIIVLGIIIRFMILQKERINKKTAVILCLVLAGGFSNLIDRIFRGYVIDFMRWFPNINFPSNNLADMYIVVGWISLAFIFAINTVKEMREVKQLKDK